MQLKRFNSLQPVEELLFRVKPEFVEEFIRIDHEVWTLALSKYPGFVSKEIWVNDDNKGEITTVLYWESMSHWKSISHKELEETQRCFDEAIGKENYSFVKAVHEGNQRYRVCKYE